VKERCIGARAPPGAGGDGHWWSCLSILNAVFPGPSVEDVQINKEFPALLCLHIFSRSLFPQLTAGAADFLSRKVIGMSTDDGSPLTGFRSGFLAYLTDYVHKAPAHAMRGVLLLIDGAHALQNALGDAVKTDDEYEEMDGHVSAVATWYNKSGKRSDALRDRGATTSFPSSHSIRWAERMRRCVSAMMKNADALWGEPPPSLPPSLPFALPSREGRPFRQPADAVDPPVGVLGAGFVLP
jgi:hypothetical protein